MSFSEMISVLIACALVNNYILQHFIGMEHVGGDSKKDALYNAKVSLMVTLVLIVATTLSFPLEKWVIAPGADWARTLTYVLIAALSSFLVDRIVIKKMGDSLKYDSINVALNSIVLGTLLLNQSYGYGWLTSYFAVVGTGIGYFLVSMVVSGLRKRIDMKAVPESFRGVPIYLATLSIMSLAVLAFA